jgi:hypothetical protein
MRPNVPKVDARSSDGNVFAVIDLDTGKTVGSLAVSHSFFGGTYYRPRRTIALFDGKYIGRFDTHEECVAFAAGVAAVLNHMIEIAPKHANKQAA